VAVAWCFENEKSSRADRILDLLASAEAVVPPLWLPEVGNALLAGERRRRITAAEVSRSLRLLSSLNIRVGEVGPCGAVEDLVALARTHSLSVYDAAFLSLAMREGIALATLDRKLGRAACGAGVRLV